jgi:hypothetical protein
MIFRGSEFTLPAICNGCRMWRSATTVNLLPIGLGKQNANYTVNVLTLQSFNLEEFILAARASDPLYVSVRIVAHPRRLPGGPEMKWKQSLEVSVFLTVQVGVELVTPEEARG